MQILSKDVLVYGSQGFVYVYWVHSFYEMRFIKGGIVVDFKDGLKVGRFHIVFKELFLFKICLLFIL